MTFEKVRVHAIIPDGKTPESILVGPDGQHPSDIFDPSQHHTIENVIHGIGRKLGARALSVAMRERNKDQDIVYRTDPLPSGVILPDGYAWKRAATEE